MAFHLIRERDTMTMLRDMAEDDQEVELTLEMTPKTNAAIEALASDLGLSKTEVFRWGLALLELANRAKKQGGRIAVIDAEGHVREIDGF